MPGALRAVFAIVALLGGLIWATLMAWGLAFCEAYDCNPAVYDKERLFILLFLVAVLGLVWTLIRGRPHVVRNAAIWLGLALALLLPGFLPYSALE
jgi:membrane protein DedA with SNARE-associated domain